MYNLQCYNAKELALAYMSSKPHDFSPQEFLQQLKEVEKSFDAALKNPQQQPQTGMLVKAF